MPARARDPAGHGQVFARRPLSIDEAFLDLSGTERLHGLAPAKVLARFAADVEGALGITVSIGLSCNKFLAKIASDLDKPRGFAVLGASEASAFLAEKPVSFIFGVGKVGAARLARDGFHQIADLQRVSELTLTRRYGEEGRRLARLARGIDTRKVSADRETKSVSAETTFERDIADFRSLERILWSQAEAVSARLKAKALSGLTVTLKLKTADFKIRTRARSLGLATQLAGFATAWFSTGIPNIETYVKVPFAVAIAGPALNWARPLLASAPGQAVLQQLA